jgi:pimeloyl-ACP methyl ester carboxylesterase
MKRIGLVALIALWAGVQPQRVSAQTLSLEQLTHCGVVLPPTQVAIPAPGVAKKPTPVIIVGGTMASELVYLGLQDRLRRAGYTVQFYPLPGNGLININEGAKPLKCVVNDVLAVTGAKKVHLIGHSQGVTVARTYVFREKAEDKVETFISLAGPHQGTQVVSGTFLQYPLPTMLGCYPNNPLRPPPCDQLAVGSALLNEIANRPANDPIRYTNFITTDDDWVVPYTNGFMKSNCNRTNAAGEQIECNIHLQKYCPNLLVDHIAMPNDSVVWRGIQSALENRKIELGCGTMANAPSNLECESTEVRVPASSTVTAPYPRAVARIPGDKKSQGFVRVGGSCEVSRTGTGSVHAAVMVENMPDGEDGWVCKAADPALIPNPAWARATVTYCRTAPKEVPSERLLCKVFTQRSAPRVNPSATVELTPALAKEGYLAVSGGCATSHAGAGSTHAENIVTSARLWNGLGWSCQAADPPNHGQSATVTAAVVACRVDMSTADRATFTEPPALQCHLAQGPLGKGTTSATAPYPSSVAKSPSPDRRILGGECKVSYAGHGSTHAEFMVKNGIHGIDGWGCFAADPPLIPNAGTAQANVITCKVRQGTKK